MISSKSYTVLQKIFKELEIGQDTTVKMEMLRSTEIQMDLNDILEGIGTDIISSDGSQKLYRVQDLKETLDPDFDDNEYEDPYADIWEAFVNARIKNDVEYLMVTDG